MASTCCNLKRLVGICCLLAAGCGREPDEPQPSDKPLAVVGDATISESDFEREVGRRQASGQALPDAHTLLQEMVQRQAMLQRAAASDVAQQPEVQREVENRLLSHWLQRELHTLKDQVTVSDADLRAVYEKDSAAWTRPAQIRLAMLFRAKSARADDGAIMELKEKLQQGVAAFRADPAAATQNGRIQGFGRLAIDYSEDTVSRYRGGDLGWLETGRQDYRWPAAVVRAGLALEIGAISEVIETDRGLYVVMKTDWRAARTTPFEEAAVALRRRLIRERQESVERDFMQNVLSETRIEINRDKAARLTMPKRESPSRAPAFNPVTQRMPTP